MPLISKEPIILNISVSVWISLFNQHSDKKIIRTIYDGIMVRPDDAGYFQEFILAHFEELVGFRPSVKIKGDGDKEKSKDQLAA